MSKVRLGYKFAPIPEWVLYHDALSPLAVRVYGVLSRHGMTPDDCFPSHETIAEKAHIAERSVARPIADLEKAGAIMAVHRGSRSGGRTSDGYWLAGDAPFTAQDSAETLEGYRAGSVGVTAQDSAVRTAQVRAPKENQGNESQEGENNRGSSDADPAPTLALVVADSFDEFWSAYTRKAGKPAAERAFKAAVKRSTPEAIFAGLKRHVEAWRTWPKGDLHFIPYPATWLNRDTWNDAVEARKASQSRRDQQADAIPELVDRMRGFPLFDDGRKALDEG